MVWSSVFVLPLHSQRYVGPDVRICRVVIGFICGLYEMQQRTTCIKR